MAFQPTRLLPVPARIFAAFVAVGLMLVSTGCRNAPFQKPLEGAFEGSLRDQDTQWVQAVSHPIDSEAPQKGWAFDITLPEGQSPVQLTVVPVSKSEIAVTLAPWLSVATPLRRTGPRKSVESNCFSSTDPAQPPSLPSVRLCIQKDSLELSREAEEGSLSLALVHESRTHTSGWETPRSFTLDEYIGASRDQNFDSRIQAERVFQSRLKVKQAYLSLLPSLNLWSGMSLASASDFTSLLSLAGSLTPFLFPSRWIDAIASEKLARADEYAWLALRLDTGLIAESAGLSYLRNRETLEKMKEQLERIRPLSLDLIARERMGLLPPGSSEEIRLLISEIEATSESLANSLVTERTYLAQTLGLTNPNGILELDEAASLIRPMPAPEDLERAQRLALGQSVEVRQLDELIRATELNRISTFLGWLDPAGGSSSNLGVALPITLAINQSQLAELRILQERTRADVALKVHQSFQNIESEEKLILKLITLSDQYSERLDRLTGQIRMGIPVAQADLVHAIQGQIKSELDLIQTRYQLRGHLGLWNRNLEGLAVAAP